MTKSNINTAKTIGSIYSMMKMEYLREKAIPKDALLFDDQVNSSRVLRVPYLLNALTEARAVMDETNKMGRAIGFLLQHELRPELLENGQFREQFKVGSHDMCLISIDLYLSLKGGTDRCG